MDSFFTVICLIIIACFIFGLRQFPEAFENFAGGSKFRWAVIHLIFWGLVLFFLGALYLLTLPVLKWLFSWRMIRRYLWAGCFLFVIVCLFYAEEDWRGKHDWLKFKKEWEAKGESFDLANFIPPPVPDGQNFALTPIVASGYLKVVDRQGNLIEPPDTNIVNRLNLQYLARPGSKPLPTNDFLGDWTRGKKTDLGAFQTYYRAPTYLGSFAWEDIKYGRIKKSSHPNEAALTTNEFPVSPQPQSAAADVLLALSKYDSNIEEMRKAALLPCSRFPCDYSVRPMEHIPVWAVYSSVRNCVQVLQLRAIAELENDNPDKALGDLQLLFYLVDCIRNEPFDYPQQIRFSLLQRALQPVWEGTIEHYWSDAQLTAIDKSLAHFDFLKDFQFGDRSARLAWIDSIEEIYAQANSIKHWKNLITGEERDDYGDSVQNIILFLKPKGMFYEDTLGIARVCQNLLLTDDELKERNLSKQIGRIKNLREQNAKEKSLYQKLILFYDPASLYLPGFAEKMASTQSSIDLARVACALERYRLAHGEYPETLDALSPQYIEKLPHDIINGQPLHYRRTDDGHFLLYSVGWNETDDGGQIVLKLSSRNIELEKGDWVWPSVGK